MGDLNGLLGVSVAVPFICFFAFFCISVSLIGTGVCSGDGRDDFVMYGQFQTAPVPPGYQNRDVNLEPAWCVHVYCVCFSYFRLLLMFDTQVPSERQGFILDICVVLCEQAPDTVFVF